MKNKFQNLHLERKESKKENNNSEGYPMYPSGDDIYNKFVEEKNINPEEISRNKESNEIDDTIAGNGNDFKDESFGSDLDVPGSELDDKQENIGNEDEENNYYSLGGDDQNDLDES